MCLFLSALSLQALRAETMVDGLPRASTFFSAGAKLRKWCVWARWVFAIVFFDFLWIQPSDFDIALSVASSDTKESFFDADMVSQIYLKKFEVRQGRVSHGDFRKC